MPMYEYECAKCGRRFERLSRMGEEKMPPCPDCHSKKTTRLISRGGFVLKGSGWYKTDYPSEARKKGMEADKGSGEKIAAKEGESKPVEKKAEPKTEKKTEHRPEKKKSGGKD
jgi:putative FmdB family regulatory protein